MSNNFFTIASLFYIVLLNIIYFIKPRIKTLETKIFQYMVICNLTTITSAIISAFTIRNVDKIPLLNEFISKFLLITFFGWGTLFAIYIISITFEKKAENIIHNDRNKIIFFIGFILYSIIICLLPLYYHNDNNIIYSYGPAANITFLASGIDVLIYIICLIISIRKGLNKKYIPLIIYVIFGTIVIVLQKIHPELLLVSSMETFVTFLMFFTIENPDVKMIEQLNILKDQADKANRAKTDFLSSMSHEIRTPLNAIVGFSNSLKDNDDLSEQAKSDVKDILIATDSLLEIVNSILDISKIEANKIEIKNKEYDAYKMFDELGKLTKVRIGEKPIEFVTEIDETMPRVLYGDQKIVKQIVLNLLTNAAKYTDQGKIKFKVDSTITGNVVSLTISVKDTGRGIKKDSINKLFTKFNRLDEDKNTTIEGTGLGLAITKKLVELMHGNIVVNSEYGKGSKFTVTIDQSFVKNPTIKLDDDIIETEDLNLKGKKVLIVDDNNLNIKVAARLLSKYNLNIESVTNGFDAIDLINNGKKYDLILLDDMMPKMSGRETLEKLKEINNFNIPVVALTANALTGMKEKYLEVGFNDYLAKPIETNELLRVLKTYLENVK